MNDWRKRTALEWAALVVLLGIVAGYWWFARPALGSRWSVVFGALMIAMLATWFKRTGPRRGRCDECGYDLHGLPREDGLVRCPECGMEKMDP